MIPSSAFFLSLAQNHLNVTPQPLQHHSSATISHSPQMAHHPPQTACRSPWTKKQTLTSRAFPFFGMTSLIPSPFASTYLHPPPPISNCPPPTCQCECAHSNQVLDFLYSSAIQRVSPGADERLVRLWDGNRPGATGIESSFHNGI